MKIDSRGPLRSIVRVGPELGSVAMDCGHTAQLNPIFSYRAGEERHCFACRSACPQCQGTNIEDNGVNERNPLYTLLCLGCDHQWMPNEETAS